MPNGSDYTFFVLILIFASLAALMKAFPKFERFCDSFGKQIGLECDDERGTKQ